MTDTVTVTRRGPVLIDARSLRAGDTYIRMVDTEAETVRPYSHIHFDAFTNTAAACMRESVRSVGLIAEVLADGQRGVIRWRLSNDEVIEVCLWCWRSRSGDTFWNRLRRRFSHSYRHRTTYDLFIAPCWAILKEAS